MLRQDGNVVLLGVLDGVVKRWCEDGRRRGCLAQTLDEGEELGGVKGEGGAAAEVGFGRVGEGGELGPREVVAVHGDEGCGRGTGGGEGSGVGVEEGGEFLGEGGFACWFG